MKSLIRKLLIPVAGIALAAAPAEAATWPPAPGDLVLGVQALGGTGATTNVFFNLGPAHALRDNPNPAGTLVNLDTELTAAFGADWELRTDLYFGVFANRSNQDPGGIAPAAPENGDAARTIYASKGTSAAGTAVPWTGFSTSALGLAATAHQGQISALGAISANGNNVATLTQAANPVQWNNSWSRWNPVPGAAFQVFGGGIQALINDTAALVDVFRVPGTTGNGTYVTTVTLGANGDVSAARAGGGNASYFTVTATAVNGRVLGGGGGDVQFADGSSAKLTAVPDSGFGFVDWSGDAMGSANPLSLLMDGNKTITANFAALPDVIEPTATDITGTGATLGGNVSSDNGPPVSERGVVFSEQSVNANPLIGGNGVTKETAAGTTGVFTAPVTGLTPGTTYAYKAFATTAAGTGYSAVAVFTTDTDVTFTDGIGTVTSRTIQPGDTQAFNFTLAEAANAAFSSSGATGISWELLDGSNNQVAAGTGPVDIDQVLEAGAYRLLITGGGSAETFSLDLDGSNAAEVRPDATVGRSVAAQVGNDQYAGLQRTILTSRRARSVTGFFTIGNDGTLADTIGVRGGGGNRTFRITHTQGGNVTGAIIAGTFATPTLVAGDPAVVIRTTVAPNRRSIVKTRRLASGRRITRTLRRSINTVMTASATSDPTIRDTAILRTQTR